MRRSVWTALAVMSWLVASGCERAPEAESANASPVRLLEPIEVLDREFPGPINYFPRDAIGQSPAYARDGRVGECVVPTGGNQKALVLLVRVNDYPVPSDLSDAATVRSRLFGDETETMKTYFERASQHAPSALSMTGDVYGWRSVDHVNAESTTTDLSEVAFASDPVVRKALEAFDGEINYADYDSNDDGCVDYLMVVHSGPDQAVTRDPRDIWSHFEFYMPEERSMYDGKEVYGTSVVSVRSPVGVFVHEMAHNLGLPDLYSHGPPNKSMIGYWSLMDLGMWSGPAGSPGVRPTALDPWSASVLGWTVPEAITDEGTRSITTANVRGEVARIDLAPASDGAARYLLVEARQNRDLDATFESTDTYLPSSGVLVWEVDEGGRNTAGAIRRLLRLHDAYPSEEVMGFAPEALLRDAPFAPRRAGVSSHFEARGVSIDVLSNDGPSYEVMVTPPGAPRPELVAQLVRVTRDPHDLGGTLTLNVEVSNTGAAPATDVRVKVDELPGLTWADGSTRELGTLPVGGVAVAEFSLDLTRGGHLDLSASVQSTETGILTLHDRAYVDGRISTFDRVATTFLGDEIALHARDTYDWLHSGCVLSCLGDTTCIENDCELYDYDAQYPAGSSFDANFCNTGSYSSCRGEITNVWVRDFLRKGTKQVLVASRDVTHRDRCVAAPGSCTRDYEPASWHLLTLYELEGGSLRKAWEFVPADHPLHAWQCFFYGQAGVAPVANVLERDGVPEILLTGLCGSGGRTAVFRADDGGTLRGQTFDNLGISAQNVLSGRGDLDRDGTEDLVINYEHGVLNQAPRLGGRTPSGGITLGSYVAIGTEIGGATSLFQNAFEGRYGPGAFLRSYSTETTTSLQPKAFVADVNGDSRDDLVYADGNGFDTGRVFVFDWNGDMTPANERLEVVRERWGNTITSMLPLDWNGDGSTEIVLGRSTDNSIRVFSHSDSGEYVEIFDDSFGGYTGTGYNPAIATGDIDGNGTRDVVLGQGGHCSVPTVGSGVYVYGLGMVLRDGDHDGDGVAEADDGLGIWAIATGDLDGDGDDEIIAGSQTGWLYVLGHRETTSEAPVATLEAL